MEPLLEEAYQYEQHDRDGDDLVEVRLGDLFDVIEEGLEIDPALLDPDAPAEE